MHLQAIEKSFNERSARWNAFTGQIAVRAKMNFINLMAGRNFLGQLKFNHMRQSLEILVETQEATAAVNDKRKREAKNLSGGALAFVVIEFGSSYADHIFYRREIIFHRFFPPNPVRQIAFAVLIVWLQTSHAEFCLCAAGNPSAALSVGWTSSTCQS